MADAVATGGFDTSSYLKPSAETGVNSLNPLQIGSMVQQKIAIDSAKLDLFGKHFNNMNQFFGAVGSDPALDPEAVKVNPDAAINTLGNALNNMVKQGLVTPDMARQELTQFPTRAQLQQNPNAARQFIETHINRNADNQAQFQRTYGVGVNQPNGAGTIGGVQRLQNPGVTIPKTFTPDQPSGATTTQVEQPEIGPEGKPTGRFNKVAIPTNIARDVAAGKIGFENGKLIYKNGQPPAAEPLVQSVGPNGAIPGAQPPAALQPASPNNPPTAANRLPVPPTAPAGASVGMTVGTPQGSDTAQAGLAQTQVSAANDLARSAAQVPQQKAALDNLESQLNDANTGPFAGVIQKYGAAANQIGQLIANKDIVNPDVVKAHENFVKNANQLQQKQAEALGGTVAALNNSGHTVPSLDFSTAGNREIIATLRGQQDAINAKNMAYQDFLKKGGSPQDFNKFENDFNQSYDPRAYQFPYMTKSEQNKMIASLPTDANRLEFFKRANEARKKGYIKTGAAKE